MSATETRVNGDTVDALAQELRREWAGPRVQVLSEPLTYQARLVPDASGPRGFRAITPGERRSYVHDLVMREIHGDSDATERLERHGREMRALGEERQRIFAPDVSVEFEQRAVSWANGAGGYSAPPLWLIEYFATVPTPERVLSRLMPQFELPVGPQSVNLPRWTAGADVGLQQLNAPSAVTDIADSAVSSAVATIAGSADVPMQMLEQSPAGAHLDWAVFTNMEARYGYQLELQLIAGTGAATPQGSGNSQLLGILNNTAIPSANIISYTGAGEGSATGATSMFSSLGLAVAKVGLNRLLPPEVWLMTTPRAAWLASSEDSQSRPLMIADNASSPGEFDLLAFPVKLADAIPRTVNGNQEPIFTCRPSDWLLLESERHVQVFRENLSGNLVARLQMRRYAAALLRQPTSVAYLTGSGMATGGGF